MKRLLFVALPAGLVLLASIFILNAWRSRGEGFEARLERARIKREFVERSAAARSMATQPPETWREESAALLRWYLEAGAALRNRFPGEPPRQNAVAAAAEEKKGKLADKERGAIAEFQQYADGRVALVKAGRYAPVASAVAEGLRLDLLAVETGPNPDGGGPGLRIDFALWGVPRTLERDGSGEKATSRAVLGVSLRQLGIRFVDAKGQLFGGMQGGGEPAIKLADPERFTDDLPPSVLFGTWWLELLPRGPATLELELTAGLRGASGRDRPAVFTVALPIDEAWRLPPGVEFKAETREGAAPAR
jgi:hypothetical protein